MKIVAGLGSIDEYIKFAEAGADEFFCGYVPYSWSQKYGTVLPLNRREVLCYNVQLGAFSELELLYFLASSPNQVFTREQLLDHIWGYEYIGDTRTVDVHIKRLREKIKDHPNWSISTVWGIGYKFEVKSE